MRGVFIAAALEQLERDTGKSVREHFDLIAGTSTGGLIALALAFGVSPGEILSHYRKWIPKIFRRPRFGLLHRKLRQANGAIYRNEALIEAAQSLLGKDAILGEARNRLCIPAVDFCSMVPTVLKTRHSAEIVRDPRLPAWEVALATSAAPTYLPPFRASDGRWFWDGGLWANDPTMVAVVEAMGPLGMARQQIDVLRIGTTETVLTPSAREAEHGGFRLSSMFSPRIVVYLNRLSEQSSQRMSHLVLSDGATVTINQTLGGCGIELDDTREETLKELAVWGSKSASSLKAEDRARFFEHRASEFVPLPLPSRSRVVGGESVGT